MIPINYHSMYPAMNMDLFVPFFCIRLKASFGFFAFLLLPPAWSIILTEARLVTFFDGKGAEALIEANNRNLN